MISIDDAHTYKCSFLKQLIEKQFEAIANISQLPTPIYSGGGAKIAHWYLNDLDYPNKVKDLVEVNEQTKSQREVDNIEGFSSVAYPVKHINENEIKLMSLLTNAKITNDSCRLSDDLVISFVMKLGGRKLINLADGLKGNKILKHVNEINPISGDLESANDPKESMTDEWNETFKESVKNLIKIERSREKLKLRDCVKRLEDFEGIKQELSGLVKSVVDFVIDTRVKYEIKTENKTKKLNKKDKDGIKDRTLKSYGLSDRYIEDPSEALTILNSLLTDNKLAYRLKDLIYYDNNNVFKKLIQKFSIKEISYKNLVSELEKEEKNKINFKGKIDLLNNTMAHAKKYEKITSKNAKIDNKLIELKNKVRFEEVKYRKCLKKLLEHSKENNIFLSVEDLVMKLSKQHKLVLGRGIFLKS